MKIENCKYDSIELAARLLFMAEKYIEFYKKDVVGTNDHLCDYPYGRFPLESLHKFFDKNYPELTKLQSMYDKSKFILNEYLGFNDSGFLDESFNGWAGDNPSIWGSEDGRYMFSNVGYLAFGKTKREDITLLDLAKQYMICAGNLLKL